MRILCRTLIEWTPIFPKLVGNASLMSNVCSSSTSQESEFSEECRRVVKGLQNGQRGMLAQAITLVESENKLKKQVAREVLDHVLKTFDSSKTLRIGISGPPGAGKSTFIEVFGKFLTQNENKVAVLAVDPSSPSTGGSLLGDKTRMPELSRDSNAYIRASPSKGCLGGVTRSTNEAVLLCEFAGYNVVLIETVGVGQSEDAVANMADIFILLVSPGGGDELQAVKRGIVERADIVVITKADGDLIPASQRAQYEYTAALKFIRPSTPNWKTKVIRVSAKDNIGIEEFWSKIGNYREKTKENFLTKRINQRIVWTWAHVREGLEKMLTTDAHIRKTLDKVLDEVRNGKLSPGAASDDILDTFKSRMKMT